MNITRKFGGKERAFGLLTQDDLRSITATIPIAVGEVIDLRCLDRWSKNPDGCDWFIWYSLKKTEPMITRADVTKTGSIMGRTNLAADIFGESITAGEDYGDPKAEGVTPPNPPTGT